MGFHLHITLLYTYLHLIEVIEALPQSWWGAGGGEGAACILVYRDVRKNYKYGYGIFCKNYKYGSQNQDFQAQNYGFGCLIWLKIINMGLKIILFRIIKMGHISKTSGTPLPD